MDGLGGDQWAIRSGRWAKSKGHDVIVDKLDQTKTVSGVGTGSQTCVGHLGCPIGIKDVEGNRHYNTFRAAVVSNSHIPGLVGIQSLARMNVVIRCRTGEI